MLLAVVYSAKPAYTRRDLYIAIEMKGWTFILQQSSHVGKLPFDVYICTLELYSVK